MTTLRVAVAGARRNRLLFWLYRRLARRSAG
jgi:hypothetical protein